MTDCAAPRHADDPVDARPHSYLCYPCERGLARDLRRLPALHADLEEVLILDAAAATGSIANVAKARGANGDDDDDGLRHLLRETLLPFNPAVSDCRGQIRHDLTWWCVRITEIRELDAPPVLGRAWAGNEVAAMCGWLHPQVAWCTFRDWAGDMAGALSADVNWAYRLLNPRAIKHVTPPGGDGICIECGVGQVEATIYGEGDKRGPVIRCTTCLHEWPSWEWLRYGERVVARRDATA